MALFKILSNMTDTSRNMPNQYTQGYCYFDVKTGKFWIDTTNTAAGRLAINSSFFGICAADQANVEVKTVACPGYVRSTGSSVYIMFVADDTYGIMNRLALNVNNTGAAVVQHHGETPDKAWCKAGHVYNFVYDGEYYQLIGDLDTTYNTLTTAIGRTGTDTEARLISASTLKTLIDDRGYTTNTGTVTNVATGAGLTGGPITTSGTIKLNLLSETKLSYDAAAGTSGNTNRVYPVALDKSGRLSVNVPWVDNNTNTTYTLTQDANDGHKITFTPSSGSATTITIPDNNTTYSKATYNYLGLMKPAYSSTGAVTLTTAAGTNTDTPKLEARSSVSQRYYAVEVDTNGVPFVNVPWVDNNSWRGIQNNLTSDSTTESLSAAMGKKLNTEKVAKAGDTMTGTLNITKAGETGIEVTNTSASHAVGFIVGASGNGGIYDRTNSKWVVYSTTNGTVQLNGNANTANSANTATSATKDSAGNVIANTYVKNVAWDSTNKKITKTIGGTTSDVVTLATLLSNAALTGEPTAPTAALGTSTTQIATTAFVTNALSNFIGPMYFMGTLGTGGTITSLPAAAASNRGHTYKVIKAGTYDPITAKIGDVVISTGSDWVLIPSGDEPSGTVTNVATGEGLTGGPITSSGTISHAVPSGATASTLGSSTARYYIKTITTDKFGHVTGVTTGNETVTNTDRYVNKAAFADDSTATAASPVKMTLTRAGSDSATISANIPKVSASSAGVAPKGAAVETQTQSTKFLREDGTWAAPSYTTNTNTHRPIQMNGTEILGNNVTPLNLKAGSNVSLSNSSGTVTISSSYTNTTYTFAGGTNSFTVTPSGGEAQTVTVTPSIANNITGSGTSGYLTKFNGANTITNGPALGTDTTKFLNNKGEWAVPPGTYSLPLATSSVRGGVKVGYETNGKNYAVQLSNEQMYVSVPWTDTDTKVTSVGNHYAPAADENAVLTVNASGASAAWSIDVVKGITINRDAKGHVTGVSVTSGKIPANPNTNYYHKTGSWNGLTYIAAKVGSPDDLAFTIPTGTTSTTVALGNHTHTTSLATDTGTSAITLAHGGKYKLTTGGTSVIFTMPADNNTDTLVKQTAKTDNVNYKLLGTTTASPTSGNAAEAIYDANITINPSTHTITATNFAGNATTATTATKDSSGSVIKDTYVKKAGDTMTGPLYVKSLGKDNFIAIPDKHFASADGTKTGAIKITLPVSWTATMMSMKVDIYNYNNDNVCTYTIGGYNYTGGNGYWTCCSAQCSGFGEKTNLTVRFGHDGTKCCIIIGETDTSWSYPKVLIRDIMLGHSGTTLSNWATGWDIGWVTTLPDNIDVIKENTNITANYPTKTGTGASGTWGISISGNAATATEFSSNATVKLTGDVTGEASAKKGWSIATTIGSGKVTNAMLAGSIANGKLANSSVSIAGNSVSLGGSLTADTLRTSLGLSNAMHFIGVTSTALTDGATTATLTAKTTSSLTKTTDFVAGDVVIDTNSSYEYVWTGAAWERLGPDGSYKVVQTAYTDSTGTSESTTATRFVYSVSQDANGVVSFKTRPLPTYNNYSLPTASTSTKGGIKVGTGLTMSSETLNHSNSVTAQTTQALYPIKIDAQGHISGYGTAVTSLPASDVSAWAKAATKPSYALSEITGADDVNAIEALTGTSGLLKKTAENTWTLDTTAYTTNTGTVTKVTAGTGLNTSADQTDSATKGSITGSGTLYLTTSGVTAGSYGPSANVTGNEGTTMSVPYITVDKYGRVTSIANKTYTAKNTTYTLAGLMGSTAIGSSTKPVYWTGSAFAGITSYEGKAATAGIADKISNLTSTDNASSTTGWRNVWMSYSDGVTGRPALSTALTFQTSTGTLKATKFSGDGSSLTALNASNLSSGTVAFARLPSMYWSNIAITSAASYNAAPEMATIKLNGNTSASAASTNNVTLVYDSTLQALNFVFA